MSVFGRIATVLGRDPDEALRRLHAAQSRLYELRRAAAAKKADLASLRAQFWGGDSSNFTHERRVQLAELAAARRAEVERRGEKITEAALDEHARSHPSYKNWLAMQHERRERMYRMEAELAQIEADAEAAQGEVELARQAIRLIEEAIRFARSEPTGP